MEVDSHESIDAKAIEFIDKDNNRALIDLEVLRYNSASFVNLSRFIHCMWTTFQCKEKRTNDLIRGFPKASYLYCSILLIATFLTFSNALS